VYWNSPAIRGIRGLHGITSSHCHSLQYLHFKKEQFVVFFTGIQMVIMV
jgi:hypothetical protein